MLQLISLVLLIVIKCQSYFVVKTNNIMLSLKIDKSDLRYGKHRYSCNKVYVN